MSNLRTLAEIHPWHCPNPDGCGDCLECDYYNGILDEFVICNFEENDENNPD